MGYLVYTYELSCVYLTHYNDKGGEWTYIGTCVPNNSWYTISSNYNINSFNEILLLMTTNSSSTVFDIFNIKELLSIKENPSKICLTIGYANYDSYHAIVDLNYTDIRLISSGEYVPYVYGR